MESSRQGRRMQYRITLRARDDLKNIGRYTEVRWGKSQRNRYLKALEKRSEWLAGSPRLGKHRPDIAAGYYSFPQGQHVVFYLIGNGVIDIIGIPHKDMDIITYFSASRDTDNLSTYTFKPSN